MKYPDKKVLIYDGGTLISVAQRLAKDFGEVYYYTNYKKDFNKTGDLSIGDGYKEFKWVLNFWDIVDEIDLFVFTSVGEGDLQDYLRKQGKLVFGSGEAECMELFRYDFIEFMEKIGMPTPKSRKVTGITELRKSVKPGEWVKQDANERGNQETWCFKDEEATELSIITPLENDLGGASETTDFIIQEQIDSIKEDGYDGFVIDGKYPSQSIYGIESKDAGYAGMVKKYVDLPDGVKYVNEALAPALKKYGMRGCISTEIREGKDGKSYMIDPTMRFPYPPTNCIIDNWLNIAECLFEGAQGNLVNPIYECIYVVELIIYSDYAKGKDFKLLYDPKYEDNIKHPYSYKNKNGSIITIKQENTDNTNVASVVYRHDVLQTAVDKCIEIASSLDGHGIKFDIEALKEAAKTLEGGK